VAKAEKAEKADRPDRPEKAGPAPAFAVGDYVACEYRGEACVGRVTALKSAGYLVYFLTWGGSTESAYFSEDDVAAVTVSPPKKKEKPRGEQEE
jgi:hypothetical protein